MIFQWRGANNAWVSHTGATSCRVEVTLHWMNLTKCAKDTDRDRRQCAETKCCSRTLGAHKTKTRQGDLDKIRMSRTGLVLRKGNGPDAHDFD